MRSTTVDILPGPSTPPAQIFGANRVFVFDGTAYTEVAQVHDQVSVGDMNNSGTIVGSQATCTLCLSIDAPYYYGFVIENGEFMRIAFPGADDTFVTGINDLGTLVGNYYDQQGAAHGFIATPVPEPATALLALAPRASRHHGRFSRAAKKGRCLGVLLFVLLSGAVVEAKRSFHIHESCRRLPLFWCLSVPRCRSDCVRCERWRWCPPNLRRPDCRTVYTGGG